MEGLEKEIGMNIYVAHLSHEMNEDKLRYAFSAFGQVRSVSVVRNETTGEAEGFVSMPIANEAQTAISEMNGSDLDGQTIYVEARAKTNVLHSRERPAEFKTARSAGAGRAGRSRGTRGRGSRGRNGRGRNSRGKRGRR